MLAPTSRFQPGWVFLCAGALDQARDVTVSPPFAKLSSKSNSARLTTSGWSACAHMRLSRLVLKACCLNCATCVASFVSTLASTTVAGLTYDALFSYRGPKGNTHQSGGAFARFFLRDFHSSIAFLGAEKLNWVVFLPSVLIFLSPPFFSGTHSFCCECLKCCHEGAKRDFFPHHHLPYEAAQENGTCPRSSTLTAKVSTVSAYKRNGQKNNRSGGPTVVAKCWLTLKKSGWVAGCQEYERR